jgi:hypothetical protein
MILFIKNNTPPKILLFFNITAIRGVCEDTSLTLENIKHNPFVKTHAASLAEDFNF